MTVEVITNGEKANGVNLLAGLDLVLPECQPPLSASFSGVIMSAGLGVRRQFRKGCARTPGPESAR